MENRVSLLIHICMSSVYTSGSRDPNLSAGAVLDLM